jgi:hypothetical protein
LGIFKESELANQINVAVEIVTSHTTLRVFVVFPGQFWKQFSLHLISAVEHTGKDRCLDRDSHPQFSKQWITFSGFVLHWDKLISREGTQSS